MPDHKGKKDALLLGKRQEMGRKVAAHIAIECYEVRNPKGIDDRENQKRVLWSFSEGFGLLDQQTGTFGSRPGFGRCISIDVNEWGYERDLKVDLLATQCGRSGQGRNQIEGASELCYGFNQRRTLQGPLCRFAPPLDGSFRQRRLTE